MRVSSSFIAGMLLCISGMLDAQNLITSYSVEEGLPQSSVSALYRDNNGYLWCGTGGGVGLYDGWEFRIPKTTGDKVNLSLTSPVRGIIPSEDGQTIWVGSEMSVSQYDRLTYTILHSYDLVKDAASAEMPVYANDTAVWVMCWGKGLYRIRIADGKSVRVTTSSLKDCCALTSDRRMVVFPDTTGNILMYELATGIVVKVSMPDQLRNEHITCIKALPSPSAEVLFLTEHGMWKLDIPAKQVQRYSLGDNAYPDTSRYFCAVDFHPDGSWWFGVQDEGVYRYDPAAKKMRACFWQQDGSDMSNLMSTPSHIVCDAFGVVWCGTDGSGLLKLLHSRVAFHSKFTQSTVTDTCQWFTRSFYELSPRRYLVSVFRGGLRLVDENSNTMRTVTSGNEWKTETAHFITESGDGRLLIGTNGSLLLLDTTNWTTEEVSPGIFSGNKFIGFVRSSTGALFVYGNGGIQKFIPGGNPSLLPAIVMETITSAVEVSPGRIIAATMYNGLVEIAANGVFVQRFPYDTHVGIPSTTEIHGMFYDNGGKLWLGTETGLMVLDFYMKYSRSYTTADGLSDNLIYAIERLNATTFAIGTARGLTLFNAETLETDIYTGADGMPSLECNTGALMFSSTRQLYIGTPSGFVVWNPLETATCFRNASILVSYSENEKDVTAVNGGSIIRDYGSGSVELRIWITDFAFPDRTSYSHQLEGSGDSTVTESGLRKVNYAALGSGFYSFLCSAQIPGCAVLERSKLLTIKIVPPFWMSGWFIAMTSMGAVVILTLILFILMRMNYQRKIRKLKMQQELDRVRQRISRDIHDEIGAGLTRIALSGDLMSQKVGTESVTEDKLKWIAGTARELSQSMKEVVWSVNPHYDSLDHMAAYFRSYIAGVAENADIRFVYKCDEKLPSKEVNPETRRNLLLILKEVVSNSMKYAEPTELRLEIQWQNEKFSMMIGDNGKGFDLHSDKKVNSNGLRNIRQRAEASGCLVAITTAPGKGTSVKISGPVGK